MAATDLPLLLSGPVLRRVEPRSVWVWVALSSPATVRVDVFTDIVDVGVGPQPATPPRDPLAKGAVHTLRIGAHLHLALVAVTFDHAAGVMPLLPGTLYAYNVIITEDDGTTHDLRSLGLLQDKSITNGGSDGKAPIADEPLGYENGRLPGFATPPLKLEDLNIAHASCSKLHGLGDALLAQVDDLVKDNRDHAVPTDKSHPSRPHQLFLTGDQIYADDVATALLPTLVQIGHALLGESPLETISVAVDGAEQRVDATNANFPPGRRQYLMAANAKFTSEAAASHLISFGEFAAMYVLSWSPAAWPSEDGHLQLGTLAPWVPGDTDSAKLLEAQKDNADVRARALPPHNDPEFINRTVLDSTLQSGAIESQLTPYFKDFAPQDARLAKAAKDGLASTRIAFMADRKKIEEDTYPDIWKIRRALANIPTYTICDDHEVTDDWNLSARWHANVLGSPLGRTIVRNALLAYTLFQGWGNDPAAFADPESPGGTVLHAAETMFPQGGIAYPVPSAVTTLDIAFGLSGSDPTVRFDYVIDGSVHRAIVMDSRTRRAFAGLDMPPALLSDDAIREQIQRGPVPQPLSGGLELLLVISPAPMVGPPLFEETLLPLAIRGFDGVYVALESSRARSVEQALTGIDRSKPTGAQFFDAEGWSNNPRALEKMLAALAAYNAPVVILAGDVHYASSFCIDYQAAGKPAVRFVHLTSSAAQNAWPDAVCSVMSSIRWGRTLTNTGSPARRFGWSESTPAVIADFGNEFPSLVGKIKHHPVILPEGGWRAHHAFTRPPDWRWDLTELVDTRKDADRPLKAQPEPLPAGDVTSAMHPAAGFGYGALAKSHVKSMDMMFLRRGTVFSNNYGHVSFPLNDAGAKTVKHALHSIRPHKDPGEDDEDYTVHVTTLAPAISVPPNGVG